jgi:general L-amino acid transport system permease protein
MTSTSTSERRVETVWGDSRTTPMQVAVRIVAGVLLIVLAWRALSWAVLNAASPVAEPSACQKSSGACWPFLAAKLRLVLFGRYPFQEQWRPTLVLLIAAALIVWSMRETLRRRTSGIRGRALLAGWLFGLAICALTLSGGALGLKRVPSELWDGLPLTILLATLSSFGAFWLSIGLALARRSKMVVISALSTAYIEFVRGVPLVGLLFMTFVLLPLALPPGWSVNSPVRALAVLTLFLAAYMAEVVRGALQMVPRGQYEAASAVGLGYWRTMAIIVLPQALTQALPALANLFISAIKETTVVFTVGMFDLLGGAESAIADPAWGGRFLEIYAFVLFIYFVLCGSVSFYSRALERAASTKT